jgi:hypothetical protein
MIKKVVIPLIVIVIAQLVILPFFNPGFFSFHDDTQVQRVFEMNQSLSNGHFPVRWVSALGYGYGYPIFNFYAPFAYYVGGIFNTIVDSLIATKIMMIVGILLSGLSMYLLVKSMFGVRAAYLSGILYLFAPYHAVDIYVRGDVAEFYATAFIPLVFFSMLRLTKQVNGINFLFASISYSLLILSHNLTAMMVTPFLILFVISLSILKKSGKIHLLSILFSSLLLGIGVAAFYILPVFAEMKYTNVLSVIGGGSHFADHFICPYQLWSSPWGYLGSVKGCSDGMLFQLGKIHIVLSAAAILSFSIVLWREKKKKLDQLFIVGFSGIGLLLSIFLTLRISEFIWQNIPFMSFFQFPWRFLIMATFFSSLLGGSVLWFMNKKVSTKKAPIMSMLTVILILLTAIYYGKYFHPQSFKDVTVDDYTNELMLKYTTSKISDEYMPRGFIKPHSKDEIVTTQFDLTQGTGSTFLSLDKTQRKIITIQSKDENKLLAKIAPFPSWKAFIDGENVALESTSKGYLLVIPPGNHTVEFKFISTSSQLLGNTISLASILILITGIIYRPARSLYEKKR